MALQHLRSSTANKRPDPAAMADGQLAANTNNGSPGLFFKDSNGALVKVGPVHVGTTAPNASPASGGTAGNSIGEQWLDTSSSKYVFKIWDGTAWRSEAGEFVDAAGDVMTGALGIIAGTAGSPGLYFSGDTNTGLYSPAADQLALSTGGTGRLFIDDGGRIMAGVSTALTNAYAIGTALTPAVQIQGNTANAAALSITRNTSAAANLLLQRGVTGTPVADTEALGQISFNGFDGSNYFNAALIRSVVDGTPGTGSMPGRLSFQTTPTGSTTPVERLRLDPAGQILAASLGTASLPVWSFTGDPNTGLYSPAADTVAISTNAVQRVTVDSSGRVGVGATSPAQRLHLREAGATGVYTQWQNNSDASIGYLGLNTDGTVFSLETNQSLRFASGSGYTERARIDTSGRLLVGTSSTSNNIRFLVQGSPSYNGGVVQIANSGSAPANGDDIGVIQFSDSNHTTSARILVQRDGGTWTSNTSMPTRLVFSTCPDNSASPVERLRIASTGLVATISSNNADSFYSNSTEGAGTTYNLFRGGHSATSTISSTASIRIYTNGNVQNTNNSYGSLSDIKLKENIVDANSQWDDIKALQVRNYNLKEGQTHTQIGLVAQEVEPISPGLVYESPDRDEDGNDLGTVTKSVNYSVLYMKAVKALQEAMERIETLEAKVAALEAQ